MDGWCGCRFVDAGTPTPDASGEPFDAGGEPFDAGSEPPDASVEPPEAPTCVLSPELAERWIAFDSERDLYTRDIYFVRADGTELTRMTTHPWTDKDPAFSHAGTVLAFASNRTGMMQIYLMDLATGDLTQLTSLPTGADQPSWSPDDSQIAFHSGRRSVSVMAADGTDIRVLATGPDDLNTYKYPCFSRDGTEVVFDRMNEIDAHRLIDGARRFIVANSTLVEETPAVSPDGVNVAYAAYCGTIEQILVTPFVGTSDPCAAVVATPVSAGDARRPAWASATVLAFERSASARAGSHRANISISTAPGVYPCDVVGPPGDNRNPTWAPVGYRLAL